MMLEEQQQRSSCQYDEVLQEERAIMTSMIYCYFLIPPLASMPVPPQNMHMCQSVSMNRLVLQRQLSRHAATSPNHPSSACLCAVLCFAVHLQSLPLSTAFCPPSSPPAASRLQQGAESEDEASCKGRREGSSATSPFSLLSLFSLCLSTYPSWSWPCSWWVCS